MNDEERQEYYTRLGIKPPSTAAIDVKDADLDSDVLEEVKEKVLVHSEVEKAKAMKGANGHEHVAEGDIRVDSGDEAAAESTTILGGKAAGEVESRAALATATILPFSLLSGKKAWVWIVVLVCVAIAVYLLLRWYSRQGKVTSLRKKEPQTIEELMENF